MPASTTIYYLAILLLSSISAEAQQILSGRIIRSRSTEVLSSVTVFNRTRQKFNMSDAGGNYRIEGRPGDTIIFSSAGYLPDTNYISPWMLEERNGYVIYLEPRVVRLTTVLIDENSNYQKDSLQRKDDYAWIYMQHKDAIVSDTNFTRGFGLSFDLNFFAQHQKEKRQLRKRLTQEEKGFYIDFRCPPAWVERVTGLHDDSLRVFLNNYRPSYAFCRKASNEDIFLYINDQVKKFRHPNSPLREKRRSSAAPPPSE
jgi:hypothetical protein